MVGPVYFLHVFRTKLICFHSYAQCVFSLIEYQRYSFFSVRHDPQLNKPRKPLGSITGQYFTNLFKIWRVLWNVSKEFFPSIFAEKFVRNSQLDQSSKLLKKQTWNKNETMPNITYYSNLEFENLML